MILLGILVALPIGIAQASFFEWTFHRYWLHRPWLPKDCFTTHTLLHHQLCKFDDTFHVVEEEQNEALHFAWWGGPLLVILNGVPWALLGWALSAAGMDLPYVAFTITTASVVGVYYLGYESMHYLMHKPMFPAVERSRVFQFMKRHHRIHHIHMNRNLNVLLPLADWALGTLTTTMPEARATPAEAREIARRHSRTKPRGQSGSGPLTSTKGAPDGRGQEAVVPQTTEGTEARGQGA